MSRPAPTVEQSLALLRGGQGDEAARVLAERLRADPADASARHLIGVSAQRSESRRRVATRGPASGVAGTAPARCSASASDSASGL